MYCTVGMSFAYCCLPPMSDSLTSFVTSDNMFVKTCMYLLISEFGIY